MQDTASSTSDTHRIQLYHATLSKVTHIQCESKKITPPYDFCQFLPNGWEFLIEILHTYYAFKYTIDCQILSNYLQIRQSYAALSATTPEFQAYRYSRISTFWLLTCYRISIHLTIMPGVPCFRHFTKFIQSQKPFQSWKVFCSRSGMACRR